MMTVAVTYGYLGQKADTDAWMADAKINSALELLQLLPRPKMPGWGCIGFDVGTESLWCMSS
jgi:hypothetical protein